MTTFSTADIASISARIAGVDIAAEWTGVDPVLPLLERMRHEGAVVLLKWDGERRNAPYTAVVQGGPLGDELFRRDGATLEEALCHVIGHYADSVWQGRGTDLGSSS